MLAVIASYTQHALHCVISPLTSCLVSSSYNCLRYVCFLLVSLPGHICAMVVTTLVLEGWSSRLDPNQSIMDDIKHVVHADSKPPWQKYFAQLMQH